MSSGIASDFATPVGLSASYITSSFVFALNDLQTDLHSTTDISIKEVRAWDTQLSAKEMNDHTLNPFSYGTDTVERQSYLNLHWRLDSNDKTFSDGYRIYGANSTPTGTFYNSVGVPVTGVYNTNFVDYNFIAPPDYGWSENKIRVFDSNEAPFGDNFAESSAVSIEFNLIDALNQDISYMLSSMQNWNNIIGDPANKYRDTYPKLDSLRRQYFNKLTGRINFRVFADFMDFFDRSFIELVKRLIPARSDFKGAEFVVESHMLERPKMQYNWRRHDVPFMPLGKVLMYGPHYLVERKFGSGTILLK
jgi:hypothetical protein